MSTDKAVRDAIAGAEIGEARPAMTDKRPWTEGKMIIRHRSDSITSGFEIGINKEHFPFGVSAPADPFMLGKCVAVVASEADARLFAAAPAMYEVLKAYEQWEADLITDDEAWAGGMAQFPTITGPLYDRMMELQAMRNAALRAANPAAFEEPAESEVK